MHPLLNAGQYAKLWAALLVWLSGAVPTLMAFPTWQAAVAYAIPGIAGVVAVYLVPNTPKPLPMPAPPVPPAPPAPKPPAARPRGLAEPVFASQPPFRPAVNPTQASTAPQQVITQPQPTAPEQRQ